MVVSGHSGAAPAGSSSSIAGPSGAGAPPEGETAPPPPKKARTSQYTSKLLLFIKERFRGRFTKHSGTELRTLYIPMPNASAKLPIYLRRV